MVDRFGTPHIIIAEVLHRLKPSSGDRVCNGENLRHWERLEVGLTNFRHFHHKAIDSLFSIDPLFYPRLIIVFLVYAATTTAF